MNKILRIFTNKRNQYTPDDDLSYCANGNLTLPAIETFPEFDEIHISCCFTWDRSFARDLAFGAEKTYNKPVKVGGPAFESPAENFIQGLYIKRNVIFTSRGCNNNCPWCIVPKIEGRLKELPICCGNVIQDNNFLQNNKSHQEKVFDMLRNQRGICFKGGLEPDLITDHFINNITSLKISELWLACDTDQHLPLFKKACSKLVKSGFNRNKIYCYALIGDDMEKNEARLREIYNAGAMPRAQLYRDFLDIKTKYSVDWERFACMWQRPASTIAHVEKGTNFNNFNKIQDCEYPLLCEGV